KQIQASQDLKTLTMKGSDINAYISHFKELARIAGITTESVLIETFLYGLQHNILDSVVLPILPNTFEEIKQKTTNMVRAKQLAQIIKEERSSFSDDLSTNSPTPSNTSSLQCLANATAGKWQCLHTTSSTPVPKKSARFSDKEPTPIPDSLY